MNKLLLATVLLVAPITAWAQDNTHTGSTSAARPGVTGNLNNPQEQANQAGQPGNARTLTSGGDASSVPTPTTPTGSSRVPQQPSPRQPGAVK